MVRQSQAPRFLSLCLISFPLLVTALVESWVAPTGRGESGTCCPFHAPSRLPLSGPATAELIPSSVFAAAWTCLDRCICLSRWAVNSWRAKTASCSLRVGTLCVGSVCVTHVSWEPRKLALSAARAEHLPRYRPLTESHLKIIPTVSCVCLIPLKPSPLRIPVTSPLRALCDAEPRNRFVRNPESPGRARADVADRLAILQNPILLLLVCMWLLC